LENISFRYDRNVDGPGALDNVSLSVEPGESIALLGPSGCGKTTLLRAIAGLERSVSGSVFIDDQLVTGNQASGQKVWVPPEKRKIGMVFQDWALFPHLTVAKNVAYGLPKKGSAEQVAQSLALVELGGTEDRMPTTLSGGQQQRVALARALAPKPRVLLLDEPFSNLDTSLRSELRTEVHRLLLDLGITSIFVTHDQEEAFVVGDRVAVMNEGQVVQVDTPNNLYTHPVNRWVADFVGEATLLRCTGAGATATTPLGAIPLEVNRSGDIDILLRPEQLRLTDGDEATVEVVEFYGHDAMVYLRYGDQPLRVRTGPEVAARRGDTFGVRFAGQAAHSFPAV
jgi:iron(III) transport system ATP-binding protein